MDNQVLDITPDPKVLIALTHSPLRPLDGLCELVDNAIDSYQAGTLRGEPEPHPLVDIRVPGEAEVRRGDGVVRVADNGPGLDRESLANAIRAGYSGNPNRYDSLGLFGMGFNIATGKLGRRTVVTSACRANDFALRVVIDLPTIVRKRRFEAPVEIISKPPGLNHGTVVEVNSWWPEGDPNAGFIVQLARISKTQLREQVARRYATLLRGAGDNKIRLLINDAAVSAFEHCVWDAARFVDRHGWGVIPARIEFSENIFSQLRCVVDGTSVEDSTTPCIECGGSDFRTVQEKVKGWIGVQRFDDNDRFGIDLIRNGRAIRIAEKDAFFNYVDDFGQSVREYPTDQQSGRIVGEVHLDHVPVDFQKQDFQRSSEEWQRAIRFLRGGSLLPSKWAEGVKNETPVSKVFQGYRKVRNFGRGDMYMGSYDPTAGRAVRISRSIEKELYQRFEAREPGYYEDAKWWEYVENASVPPLSAVEECSNCGFQNRPGDETCGDCGRVLMGKPCVECGLEIVRSATSCLHCGASQVPDVAEPWRCHVCQSVNDMGDEHCAACKAIRGTQHPCSSDVLRRDGVLQPELSFEGRSIVLADGSRSEMISVRTYHCSELKPRWDGPGVPTVTLKSPGMVDVYVDPMHSVFAQLGVRIEEAVAIESAQYLYSARGDLIGKPGHSVFDIASQIVFDVWGERIAVGPETVRELIRQFFAYVADKIPSSAVAADFYGELSEAEQSQLANELISIGLLGQVTELIKTGSYMRYAMPSVIVRYFEHAPGEWFGIVFADALPDPDVVGQVAADSVGRQLIDIYRRCLEDCAEFLRYTQADRLITARARSSLEYLEARLA